MLAPARFAKLALACVQREFPYQPAHVLERAADLRRPRELHPAFYGCYDWHSAVHGHWLLAHLARNFPALEETASIRRVLGEHLSAANLKTEARYLESHPGFERPYGWAWLLKLQAELGGHETDRWADALAPLAAAFAGRLASFLPKADYPLRAGAHSNSAFALRLALDYATSADPSLTAMIRAKAMEWYGGDQNCPAWEPSGDDFLSPALIEAELMRRVLEPARFQAWFAAFLPQAAEGAPASLFSPVRVSDRSDGKIAHLDGLNLSRAWCWRSIGQGLAPGDPVRAAAGEAARRHLEASLPHLAGDYMGEHWLASFALLALDE